MDLRSAILKEHSKANCDKIVHWIGKSQARFDKLFKIFLSDEYKVVQRAAWSLSNSVIAHPELIRKHYKALFKNLDRAGLHPAVKRNTVRLLEDLAIPDRFHGSLMDRRFNYLIDPAEKPAIKASAITILKNLANLYPDIKGELKTIIADRWEHESAAFKARARSIK